MSKLKVFLEMIKFEHTIFALPYAYLGAFLAARFFRAGGWPSWGELIWITLAMVGARTAAMGFNRLIDWRIDAKNPRTSSRAIPKGLLAPREVIIYIVAALLLMGYAAYRLNPLCFKLMPVAVVFLTVYSYTKRFTWLCHLVLGITDGLAPMGGWIAITGSFNLPGVLLSLAVAIWIAGFDIIYACQDWEFDKSTGLKSIPVRFGIPRSLTISSVVHVLTALLWAMTGVLLGRGLLYFLGVAVASVLLYRQHQLVPPEDLSRLNFAFFNINSYISLVMFLFTVGDLLWKVPIFY
ncbi:MAG: putative 4-hydroxybenzoate polyprenyltransferase [Peptococcaceae bacterium]|nr:putative 4-hydroxybenzoate polyprenyltransferase [Peptococcaceae bacterium]